MIVRSVALAAVVLVLLPGCGGDDAEADTDFTNATAPSTLAPTPSAEDDADSEYCSLISRWTAHEMDGDGDTKHNPEELRTYWYEYVDFLVEGARTAPASLQDDWFVGYEVPRIQGTAIFEKYEFDRERMEEEGTDAEEAWFEPTAEQRAAQDAVHEYEARVCFTAQPSPADISFDGVEADVGYCEAVAALDGTIEEDVTAEKMAPEAVRSFLTGDYEALLDEVDANAPPEIEADVHAVVAWDRNEWLAAIEKYDYDFRKLFNEGDAADRAAINTADPAIRDQFARTLAYEEQLCDDGGLF